MELTKNQILEIAKTKLITKTVINRFFGEGCQQSRFKRC
jgi:hypothetical protein